MSAIVIDITGSRDSMIVLRKLLNRGAVERVSAELVSELSDIGAYCCVKRSDICAPICAKKQNRMKFRSEVKRSIRATELARKLRLGPTGWTYLKNPLSA
jgi:hypothetical protein